MSESATPRIVPLIDLRSASLAMPQAMRKPGAHSISNAMPTDLLGRPLRDLRISVTDRCNFRCNYCMPKEVFDKDYAYLPHASLLSFEEITRTARLFAAQGDELSTAMGGEQAQAVVRTAGPLAALFSTLS